MNICLENGEICSFDENKLMIMKGLEDFGLS
jgi:hypothetical protein